MAFNNKVMSGNIGAGGGTRLFTYATPDDRATVETAGYFNELHLTVKSGDAILVKAVDEAMLVSITKTDITAKTVLHKTTMSEGGL